MQTRARHDTERLVTSLMIVGSILSACAAEATKRDATQDTDRERGGSAGQSGAVVGQSGAFEEGGAAGIGGTFASAGTQADAGAANTPAAGAGGVGGTEASAGEGGTPGDAGQSNAAGTSNAGGVAGSPQDLPSVLSRHKPVTADSEESGHPATQGNDGIKNADNRWCPNSGTPPERWWSVDLGASHALTQINIAWEFYESATYNYKIETCSTTVTSGTCNDASSWTLLVDRTADNSAPHLQVHEIVLPERPQARHLRITVTKVSAGWACFQEFDVLGY